MPIHRIAAAVAFAWLISACSFAQAGILIEIQQLHKEVQRPANALAPAADPSLSAAMEKALSEPALEPAVKENCTLAIEHLAELKQPFSTSIRFGQREIKIAGEAKLRGGNNYALKLSFKDQDTIRVEHNENAVSTKQFSTNVDLPAGKWMQVSGLEGSQAMERIMVRITEQSTPATLPAAAR